MKTLKEIVTETEKELHCNCDLDMWQPERDTGHSFVCRIHKRAVALYKDQKVKINNLAR